MKEPQRCPLCDYEPVAIAALLTDQAKVACPRCGEFLVDSMLRVPKVLAKELKPYLSIYTRICKEGGRAPIALDTSNAEQLAESYKHTTVPQKLDYLMRLLAKRTEFAGQTVSFDCELDYPAIAAKNREEAKFLVSSLAEFGYVSGLIPVEPEGEHLATARLAVTVEGWKRVEVGDSAETSGRCFVAMSFDPSLDDAYELGIERGVSDAGYEPVKINKVHHNEKICDKILAEIRQAQFLVADVTLHKQGVYFEAGFAMALGRPVIWACRDDDLKNAHFDTRQYNHIVWKTPEDLREQLRDRIIATIGRRLAS